MLLRGPHTKTHQAIPVSIDPRFSRDMLIWKKQPQGSHNKFARACAEPGLGSWSSSGTTHITQQCPTLLCTADDPGWILPPNVTTVTNRHSRGSMCLSEFPMPHQRTPTGTTTTCRPPWSGPARRIPQLTGANTTGLGLDTRSGCSRSTLPVGRADHPVNRAALA